MRKALLAVTPTIARLALIMSLLISGYAIAGLLHLVTASRGRVVTPDTGFLLAILLVFGAGSRSLFGVGAAVRRRPSRDLGLRILVMTAAYALMIALFAGSDLSQPFYGLISTLGTS
jgi:hypothetical protein